MTIFTACPSCAGAAVRNDPLGMRIVTSDASHFAIFIQRQSSVEFGFDLFYFFHTPGRGYDPHVVNISRMVSCDMMASVANHFYVADKGDILEGRMLFIGFVTMANQTGRNDDLLIFIQLQMRIFPNVALHDVAIIAKINAARIGCTPQRVSFEEPFLTLAVDIVACQTGDLSFFQRKFQRHPFLFLDGWRYIDRVDIHGSGLGMAAA